MNIKKFFFLFSCFLFVSCQQSLSSQVYVLMHSANPGLRYIILNYKGRENSICRRGIPDNYLTPWDADRERSGERELQESETQEGSGGDQQQRGDEFYVDVDDYWFKFAPAIENNSRFYIVITEINIRVFRGNNEVGTQKFEGGWCGTDPLYFFEPKGGGHEKSRIGISDIGKRFHKGNLIFFMSGLSVDQQSESQAGSQTALRGFQQKRLPRLSVQWEVLGYFAQRNGSRVGGLQKRGAFSVLPSSF